MKKSFVVKGVLAGILALGVFASCKAETEDGEEKAVVETNELAGKKFAADFHGDLCSIDFKNDTYTITSNALNSRKYCGEYYIREEETYSYTVNSEIGYFLSKQKELTKSYVRDGITLYTEPNTIPETFEAYKSERTKLFKVLNPDITEAQVEELLNEDHACESAESFNKWRELKLLHDEAEKKCYLVFAYRLEENKLITSNDSIETVLSGLKFGDIFNGIYEFSSCSKKSSDVNFDIYIGVSTIAKEHQNIEIIRGNDVESAYTILSATNDSMTIAKVTGWKDGYSYIEYDESKAFTSPIAYTDGENKVTATITIEGKEYSFDIEYVTKELINKILEEDSDTYMLQ